MNYAQNLSALGQLAGGAELATDPDFLAQLPIWIYQAEQRILRDLDLLKMSVEDATGHLDPDRRIFILPSDQGTFQVLQTVRIVVDANNIKPLLPISREAMDWIYPGEDAVGVPSIPRYWAPNDQTGILVGPAPDKPYRAIVYGTQRPIPLSTINTETFITSWFFDLFLAAEMIQVSAWQRLFSAMSDDPATARNWTKSSRHTSASTPTRRNSSPLSRRL